MAEHTPGPWFVAAPDDEYIGGSIFVETDTGRTICQLHNEANARLIAAAPDLLEALTRVMEWISGWDPNFSYDSCWPADRDKARAAIARATGEK